MSKDERQAISINIWRNSKGLGTLNLIMRFGKTRIAKLISEKVVSKNPKSKIVIIVPNDITKKNAIENMVVSENTYVYTSNSYIEFVKHKQKHEDCDLLIIDEIHKLLDGKIYSLLLNIKAKYKLGLTGATMNDDSIECLNKLNMPIIDIIREDEALANNWISHYIEYNLAVELEKDDKLKYIKYSRLISETLETFKGSHTRLNTVFGTKIFNSDFDVALSAFTGKMFTNSKFKRIFIKPNIIRDTYAESMGWSKDLDLSYEYNQRIDELYNPIHLYDKAKLFKYNIKQRNDILICNRPKLNAAIEVINMFKNKPCICFNESTEMADLLQEHFSSTSIAYHSNIESKAMINPETGDYYRYKNGNIKIIGSTTMKKLAIEGIRKGYYKQLFTAKALNEGITLENIELVITTGGDTNLETHAQRRARGLTIDYANPNKVCIVVNLFIDDFNIDDKFILSRDKQKLKLRQHNTNVIPIWVSSVSEIKNI